MIACGGSEEFQCLIPRLGKKRVQERAAAHDPVALYTWGHETRQTKPQECLRLITESAELSFVFAQRWLGFSYSSGTDAPKDCQKARYWLDRAGQQGDVLSVARRSVMKMKDCSARLKHPVDRGRNEIEPGDSACGRYSSVVLADVFANLLVRP
jgi:TPR repeat protein